MKQEITWILIANAARALIYQTFENPEEKNLKDYKLSKVMTHEESRLKSHDLSSDKLGRYNAPMGSSRGKFMPDLDPHEKEQVIFAKEVATFVDSQLQQHKYTTLIVCAAPHFHGLLNQEFSDHVKNKITYELQKDYVPLPQDELEKVLEKIVKDHVKI